MKLAFYRGEDFVDIALKGERVAIHQTFPVGDDFAASLVPCLHSVWEQASFPPLSLIAAHRGPDAFTTLRVSLAAIQGIALSCRIRIFAPTHFELLAYGIRSKVSKEPCLILLDTKSKGLYGQIWEEEKPYFSKFFAREDIANFKNQYPQGRCFSLSSLENTETIPRLPWAQLLIELSYNQPSLSLNKLMPEYAYEPVYAQRST